MAQWKAQCLARSPPTNVALRHMLIEFVVGALFCSEGFSPSTPLFLPTTKIHTSKFQFNLETVDEFRRATSWKCQMLFPYLVFFSLHDQGQKSEQKFLPDLTTICPYYTSICLWIFYGIIFLNCPCLLKETFRKLNTWKHQTSLSNSLLVNCCALLVLPLWQQSSIFLIAATSNTLEQAYADWTTEAQFRRWDLRSSTTP